MMERAREVGDKRIKRLEKLREENQKRAQQIKERKRKELKTISNKKQRKTQKGMQALRRSGSIKKEPISSFKECHSIGW